MGKKRASVPVTMRAVMQRLNRKLAKDGEKMVKARGKRAIVDLGEFYVLRDSYVGGSSLISVAHKNVDFESWARESGVLEDWERIVDDDN
jgi:hypothetical protein